MRKGILITMEGIDGSGKTTQARFLKNYFEKKGFNAVFTKEPGGTLLGKRVREILLTEEMNPVSEFLLFASDRREHVEKVILPALNAGNIIISDRFHDSSVAYQGYGRGVSLDFINYVHRKILENLLPDITFIVDVPPVIGLGRLGKTDRIERSGINFLKKVREGYLEMASKERRFFVVDGTKEKETVHKEIVKVVQNWRDFHEK
jgi:dTMP kinase